MSIGAERLKELRGTESQASFAEKIGINRIQYFKYESGKNAPSIDVLARICRVHACSADWLLGLKENCSHRENNSGAVKAGAGGTLIAGAAPPAACAKCPYKKKFQAMEKLMGK